MSKNDTEREEMFERVLVEVQTWPGPFTLNDLKGALSEDMDVTNLMSRFHAWKKEGRLPVEVVGKLEGFRGSPKLYAYSEPPEIFLEDPMYAYIGRTFPDGMASADAGKALVSYIRELEKALVSAKKLAFKASDRDWLEEEKNRASNEVVESRRQLVEARMEIESLKTALKQQQNKIQELQTALKGTLEKLLK